MKRKILSLLLTFCLALIPGLCVNAEETSATNQSAPKPYHVDLTDFFEADIFYDNGDTDASIGFDANGGLTTTTSENANFAFPRSVVTGSSFLENGVLSFSGNDIKLSYGYKSVHSNLGCIDLHQSGATEHGSASCQATDIFKAAVPTLSFDVASIVDNTKNNAVVIPHDAETKPTTQTIAGVFSGNPTKYLSFLFAVPNSGGRQYMTVTYADGTTEEFYINHNTASNSSAIGGLQAIPMYYDATEGWKAAYNDSANNTKLVACAIDTGDKAISSIVLKRLQSWSSGKYHCTANLPILAITEIPSSSEYIEGKLAEAVNAADFPTNISDSASYLKVKKAIEYKEILDERGYTLSDATISEKITNLQKQYNALKPHMVDLTDFFEADIFYDNGDTDASIGFDANGGLTTATAENANFAIPRSVVKASSFLNNGVLSFSGNDIKLSYGYKTVHSNLGCIDLHQSGLASHGSASCQATDIFKAAVPTLSFNVASIVDSTKKNAVVIPHDAETKPSTQTIAGVFSGKPTKYLSFLFAVPKDGGRQQMNVTYADGTTEEFDINHNTSQNSTAIGNLQAIPMYYDATAGWTLAYDDSANYTKLVACAIDTGDKAISSIVLERFQDWSNDQYSCRANLPILAITEIPSSFENKVGKLDALITEIDGDVVDVTTQKKAVEAIEIADTLVAAGYSLDADTTSKIAAYKAQVKGLEPHMVDLTSAFNRDIFAKENETVDTSWGFLDGMMPIKADGNQDSANVKNSIKVGLIEDDVKAVLTDNIFSKNDVATFYNRGNGENTILLDKAALSQKAVKTPFDLSKISEDKNAIAIDTNDEAPVIINSGFSGKAAKYLLVLSVSARNDCRNTYEVTYTDGKEVTYEASTPWAGAIQTTYASAAAAFNEKAYYEDGKAVKTTGGSGHNSYPNRAVLTASAIELQEKAIASIKVLPHADGIAPIIAMTEIPLDYEDLCEDFYLDWDFETFTSENADDVVALTDAAIELYNRGYYDEVTEDDYFDYAYANIKAKAIKEVGDDTIYVVNNFTEANGEVIADLTLTNTSSEEKQYILAIASYSENGEKLNTIVCDDEVSAISAEYMEGTNIKTTISIPTNSEAEIYKLFVWENLSTLKPIATFTK